MNSHFTLDIPRTNSRVWRAKGRNVSLDWGNLALRVEAREFLYRHGIFDLEGIAMAKWKQDPNRWKCDIGVKGQFHLVNTEFDDACGYPVFLDYETNNGGYSSYSLRMNTPGIVFSESDRGVAAMFKLAWC